jgi:hypothetical protein
MRQGAVNEGQVVLHIRSWRGGLHYFADLLTVERIRENNILIFNGCGSQAQWQGIRKASAANNLRRSTGYAIQPNYPFGNDRRWPNGRSMEPSKMEIMKVQTRRRQTFACLLAHPSPYNLNKAFVGRGGWVILWRYWGKSRQDNCCSEPSFSEFSLPGTTPGACALPIPCSTGSESPQMW